MKLHIAAATLLAASVAVLACSSSSEPAAASSSRNPGVLDGGAFEATGDDDDVLPNPTNDVPIVKLPDGGTKTVDEDSGVKEVVPPYATKVVSFAPGKCAGFGASKMPNIVLGPPAGGGEDKGSTDVVSLGTGGEIVLSFEPNVLVDGPGPDLLVFENAFYASGADKPFAEIAEVSVSEDGSTWHTFPCTATAYPWGSCAGWHTVSPEASSSLDPAQAGGDPFDLADLGVSRARFVRIVDKGGMGCNPVSNPKTNGFDLDAIAALHVASPHVE